ncbi:hypothetical protein VE25_19560 [Devosia geojensis]|uniref:Uncharacterized protein n=1 Tax=Devosia geojensis TaxID=443610 RepID=A0A0F5FDT3_9HYPH|nr:hypothetical protein [Devosia geojensis]KKB07049.1 hypothetical protein VE25_19560 [Devosia geojensis]
MAKFINRRNVLFGAVGVMSVLATRDFFLLYCRNVSRNTPDFFASLGDESVFGAARAVGRQVKRLHPDFGTETMLARFYGERPLLLEAAEETCLDTRKAMLQSQCGEDFSNGRCLVVDGWVISETEAQLCAAVA